MRITLLNQFYPPDFAPTGRLAESLAEHRVLAGDQVTVLASSGGYVPGAPQAAHGLAGSPHVLRIWTPRFGKRRLLGRLLDYTAFFLGSLLRLSILHRQDLIISMTTPPFIAWAAVPHVLLHPSARLVLWNMDCYPEIAERTGVIKAGGLTSQLLHWINERLFRRLSGVVFLDQAMRSLLLAGYHVDTERTNLAVLPTWEPEQRFAQVTEPLDWAALGIDEPAYEFVVLYMGNTGRGHEFETTLELAMELRDEPVSFVFIGGGGAWDALQQAFAQPGFRNVRLYPYVPDAHVPSILAHASCGLVTMRSSLLGVISPSKIYAYLAMSLPLIYFGPPGSNVDDVIGHFDAGVSMRQGDARGAAAFIRGLASNPARLTLFRERSRHAYYAAFSDIKVLPQFDAFIDTVAQ